MDTVAWIAQVLLALAFTMAGFMKAMQPKEKIAANMAWANDFSAGQIKAIGIVEVLGALGLILPSVTRILPVLTPIAALGLAVTMVGAAYTHYRRGEMSMIAPNAVLLILALALTIGGCTANQNRLVAEMVAAGADPIKAHCAIVGVQSSSGAMCGAAAAGR